MALIKKNPHVIAEKLADNVGISVSKIKEKIKRLKESGATERIGSDRGGHWVARFDAQ